MSRAPFWSMIWVLPSCTTPQEDPAPLEPLEITSRPVPPEIRYESPSRRAIPDRRTPPPSSSEGPEELIWANVSTPLPGSALFAVPPVQPVEPASAALARLEPPQVPEASEAPSVPAPPRLIETEAVAPNSNQSMSEVPTVDLFARLEAGCPPDAVEPLADIGALTPLHRACIEVELGTSGDPVLRNRLSLALIANAKAQSDDSWTGLVERHLSEIDPGNPSLALRLGLHAFEQHDPAEASDWAAHALEHRAAWPPGLYEERTWAAYQLAAAAAQQRWRTLEESGEATEEALEAARQQTAEAASAWAEYAAHTERKGTTASRLCRVARIEC